MLETYKKYGKKFTISAIGQLQSVDVDMSNFSAYYKITKGKLNGQVLAEGPMDYVADTNRFEKEIDTSGANWEVGIYYYDIRITDDNDNDYWSEPVKLTLQDRNSPPNSVSG
jgi:hypothetical protein